MRLPLKSVKSSLCGAAASCLLKMAFDWSDDSLLADLSRRLPLLSDALLASLVWHLRAVCLALGLLSNAVMLKLYVDAMKEMTVTSATTLNFALSFVLSGCAGSVVFGERLPLPWWGGAGLMLTGVVLLCHSKWATRGRSKTSMCEGGGDRTLRSVGGEEGRQVADGTAGRELRRRQ
ncbi:unnamed protein product [Vitrella brassicaformis CCMP3155]|uniref:EamA domain-containing protein n=1 Tax=Vitrella brassicaformis (strain CCMP3155) TaxID=1169540 RepID=A0A0G4F7H2_VITBC|nr:unnamed protein product [Vitrella brassicaformis CCMP3155]|eukprot:CEM08670.1 unnamed protein product [Vitrella brassicaformis CCMP3155]